MTRIYAIVGAAVLAALLGVSAGYKWFFATGDDKYAQCREGQVAGGAIGGPFTLVDQTGTTVTDKEVLKKPSLVYFGYTFCPDVCPLDAQRNADAVDILAEMGLDVTPVFITIDPARDTVPVMADYAANFEPRLVGLTGTEAQIRAAAQAYKVFYQKQDSGDEFYLMDHTVFTYLMLPTSGFVDFYKRDVTAQDMARSVGCFLQAS